MSSSYLFDSHALLAFFQNETGADAVARILRKAMKTGAHRFICLINLWRNPLYDQKALR